MKHLTFAFSDELVLSDVHFHLDSGDRVGLVGDNGSGKSTLLKLLAGLLPAPSGALQWAGGSPTLLYMRQSVDDDALVDDGEVRADRGAPLWTTDSGARPVASSAVNAEVDAYDGPTAESGGERMRRRLRRLLARRPALLLLDEPTNHLDEDAVTWVEKTLIAYRGTVMLASHDRALLDAVCTRIFALERGRLSTYRGNWTAYREQVEAARLSEQHRHKKWRQEERHLREAAQRQRQWADKSFREASVRDPAAQKRAAMLAQKTKATERRLARHREARADKPWEEPEFRMAFHQPRRLPQRLVRLDRVTFAYPGADAAALSNVSLDVRNGERLAVAGPNGSGKSTLLRLVAGRGDAGSDEGAVIQGNVEVAPSATLLWFRQEGAVDEGETALRQMLAAGVPDVAQARTLLGAFAIRGEAALRPAGQLSPGERVRLGLCLAIVSDPDLLILDEPTNHLDVAGREALEKALGQFPGTVLFSSHDRAFRERVATRVVWLERGRLAEGPEEGGTRGPGNASGRR